MKKLLFITFPFLAACNIAATNPPTEKKLVADTVATAPETIITPVDYKPKLQPIKWSGMKEMTDETFKSQVLASSTITLVDFNATWCGPCQQLKPALARLVKEYDGKINFASVDVDACPGTANLYQISSIPTLAFYQSGGQGNTVVGLRPYEDLKAMIGKQLKGK